MVDYMASRFIESFRNAIKSLASSLPIMTATILLISLLPVFISKDMYLQIFTHNLYLDSFIGATFGSISAGNPITSYILGGELLHNGIPLIVVTSFLVAWVTVGLLQFPAEAKILGNKFAIYRNLSAFVLAIIFGFVIVFILGVI